MAISCSVRCIDGSVFVPYVQCVCADILEVRHKGEVWKIAHKYSDFFILSEQLSSLFPNKSTIKLPPDTLNRQQTGRMSVSPTNKLDTKMLADRKRILWSFVADCSLQPAIMDSEPFRKFLMPISAGLRDKVTRRLSLVEQEETIAGLHDHEHKGILQKRGLKGIKGWKQRYFELEPSSGKLMYKTMKKEEAADLHGMCWVLSLAHTHVSWSFAVR